MFILLQYPTVQSFPHALAYRVCASLNTMHAQVTLTERAHLRQAGITTARIHMLGPVGFADYVCWDLDSVWAVRAQVGISTARIHARGPVDLADLKSRV